MKAQLINNSIHLACNLEQLMASEFDPQTFPPWKV